MCARASSRSVVCEPVAMNDPGSDFGGRFSYHSIFGSVDRLAVSAFGLADNPKTAYYSLMPGLEQFDMINRNPRQAGTIGRFLRLRPEDISGLARDLQRRSIFVKTIKSICVSHVVLGRYLRPYTPHFQLCLDVPRVSTENGRKLYCVVSEKLTSDSFSSLTRNTKDPRMALKCGLFQVLQGLHVAAFRARRTHGNLTVDSVGYVAVKRGDLWHDRDRYYGISGRNDEPSVFYALKKKWTNNKIPTIHNYPEPSKSVDPASAQDRDVRILLFDYAFRTIGSDLLPCLTKDGVLDADFETLWNESLAVKTRVGRDAMLAVVGRHSVRDPVIDLASFLAWKDKAETLPSAAFYYLDWCVNFRRSLEENYESLDARRALSMPYFDELKTNEPVAEDGLFFDDNFVPSSFPSGTQAKNDPAPSAVEEKR